MKIFNWVQRKFQNKDEYWNEEVKKIYNNHDDKVVEVQVPLADAIDSWRNGILTIGTFGFHPLKHFNQLNKENQLVSINEEQNEEEYSCNDDDETNGSSADDQNHLLPNAHSHGDQINGLPHSNVDDLQVNEAEITFAAATTHADATGDDSKDIISYNFEVENDKKKMKERITLADLFSADRCNFSEAAEHEFMALNCPLHSAVAAPAAKLIVIQQPEKYDVDAHILIKKLDKEKEASKLTFSNKKLISPLSQSHPVKKINRMMTKMLKRKIHPQVDQGKTEKKGSQMKNNSSNVTNERVSLLQTQDFIASA